MYTKKKKHGEEKKGGGTSPFFALFPCVFPFFSSFPRDLKSHTMGGRHYEQLSTSVTTLAGLEVYE